MTRWQKVHFEGASPSLLLLLLPPPPSPLTSMINHERKKVQFLWSRRNADIIDSGCGRRKETVPGEAIKGSRSSLDPIESWKSVERAPKARAKKERTRKRERGIEVKRETRFPSFPPPPPPLFSDYPISCSTIRAAGRKLLNYCRLTDRFFRVALISRRKGGSGREREGGEEALFVAYPGRGFDQEPHRFLSNREPRSIPPVTSLPTEPITPRSTAKRNQFVSPLVAPPPTSSPSFQREISMNAIKYVRRNAKRNVRRENECVYTVVRERYKCQRYFD